MEKIQSKQNNPTLASARLQVILLAFTGIILSFLFSRPIVRFYSKDMVPPISVLTPKQAANFGGPPSTVSVGLYIRDFPEFDVISKQFVADLKIWFKFDPKLISLDGIGKFVFDKAKILSNSGPTTKIDGKDVIAQYDVRVDFQVPLNYENFPIDDHKISFSLTNYSFSPSEVIFESSRHFFEVSQEAVAYGWRLVDRHVKTGYHEGVLDLRGKANYSYHPRVIFSLDYARVGVRRIISIIIPLLLVFFISLFTLCMLSGIPISVATITGIIAHRFIIENMSPKTGYFMISDYVFIVLLLACSIIFIVNIFGDKVACIYKNLLVVFMHAVILFMFSYLLFPSL